MSTQLGFLCFMHQKQVPVHGLRKLCRIIKVKLFQLAVGLFNVVQMPSTSPSQPTVALLDESALQQLLRAGAVSEIVARGSSSGFVLALTLGSGSAILVNSSKKPRAFASINTIALMLQRFGQTRFEVDVKDFVPGLVRAAQPKRSATMLAGKLPRAVVKKPAPNTKVTKK